MELISILLIVIIVGLGTIIKHLMNQKKQMNIVIQILEETLEETRNMRDSK